MDALGALLYNTTLTIPISAMLGVQIFKFLWQWMRQGQMSLAVLLSTGGMPSSHSALVTSLATAVGLEVGFNSPFFSIATVLALIVMYDARGVRQQSGQHARILNQILRELFTGQPISERELKELLGHTTTEVFVGAVIGITYALLLLANA